LEICGARPVSTCKVHDFVLVHVIACLLFFYLFRLATRNGSSHCIGPKKKQATRLVCLCCFFVCSFAYLFDRLFVSLLIVFYLFRLATRNGSSHCIGPKKKQATLLVCFFVPLFVRLLICLIACLFVCLILFSFVSFLISLLFDDRCSDKC